MTLGTMALGYIFKPSPIEGPRLQQTEVQTAKPGENIATIYGVGRKAGSVIWTTGRKEHSQETSSGGGGGKGAPAQSGIEYYYTWSGAILVCKGPMARIEAISANEHKLYDYNGGDQEGYLVTQSEFTYDPVTGSWTGAVDADGGTCAMYMGTETQLPDPTIEADKGVGNVPAYRDRCYVVFDNLNLGAYGWGVPTFTFTVRNLITGVAEIYTAICEAVGLEEEDLDVSALEEDELTGFMLLDRAEARNYLAELETAYQFRSVEIDHKIVAVKRGGESVVTIPADELQVRPANSSDVEGERAEKHQIDIPSIVELEFFNPARDYNTDLRPARRYIIDNQKQVSFSLPMTLAGGFAHRIAKVNLYEQWIERYTHTLQMGWKYLYLAPEDVITYTLPDGREETVLLTEMTAAMLGPINCKAVGYNEAIYSLPLGPDGNGLDPVTTTRFGDLTVALIETNAVTDSMKQALGFYAAATCPPDKTWRTVMLSNRYFVNSPFGSGWNIVSYQLPHRATMGSTVSALPDFSGGSALWDEESELVVDFIYVSDDALASATELEVLNGANGLLVGQEIVQFQTAEYLGEFGGKFRWKLTNLHRGVRGTESFIADHGAHDAVVLLNGAVNYIAYNGDSPTRDLTITIRDTEGNTTDTDLTVRGRVIWPYSPTHISWTKTGNDWTVEWVRRYSGSTNFWDSGGEPPLASFEEGPFENDDGEQVFGRQYTFQVLDGGGNVLRNIRTPTESVTYTEAQQIEDFGSAQTEIDVKIYQNSTAVGKGYPAEVTLSGEEGEA